ncbi:hypothetical protein DPQ33_16580 [Oceanidesulfovibrio indonesiensis]|uniref:EF-hand domain-containing protein n=1 Tax=Oceanidesulfovibrio indonesiensis TaxID=54767 RepID=A0A7M3MBE9_9BACT|nr:hypothetical protein [Oceanidesulfovibrio indonesiensis]TVM14840.1 hypothetical protein DPQ33_16580 [Oceanidesulfovibrio indonesiensis]
MFNKIFRIVLALVVAMTLAFASTALAAETTFEKRFEEMDTNDDSYVDREEFIANYEGVDAEKTFEKIDKDKSNTLSKEEWVEYKSKKKDKDRKDKSE